MIYRDLKLQEKNNVPVIELHDARTASFIRRIYLPLILCYREPEIMVFPIAFLI
jgi:hypothetical protein